MNDRFMTLAFHSLFWLVNFGERMMVGGFIDFYTVQIRYLCYFAGHMNIENTFRKLFFLIAFSFLSLQVGATHIVGGEIFYDYVGGTTYRVTMYIYRDCANGVPPFDNPAAIGIFDQDFNLVSAQFVNVRADSILIPSLINNPCFVPPTNICYRRATYIFNVNLTPSSGTYYIAYQRCCRNNTINNIIAPGQTGATYVGEIRLSSSFINSSPRFDSLPPPFACLNYPLVFDHSATDPDGDSIRYSLCTPLNGADTLNPAPAPPAAPPYNNIIFVPPYNVNNMLNGTPGIQPLSIDSITGLLTATPNTIGQFVIGVCAKEYRNNVYLGQTRRDYQLNIVPCPSLVVAAFLNPIVVCGSNTVSFQNGSFGAIAYHWDFGVTNQTNDTSNAINPVFTYPDTGTYTVTLIAYSIFNPGCADTIRGTVSVNSELITDFTSIQNQCSSTVTFRDTIIASVGGTYSYNWNFGDNTTATGTNPQHTYGAPGTYAVTLIVASSTGCRDTVTKSITILRPINATTKVIQNVRCKGQCNGSGIVVVNNNNGPFTILWNNPPGQTNDTLLALCADTYSGTVTDSVGCTTTFSLVITEPPLLTTSVNTTPDYCGDACVGTAAALAAGGTPPFSYSWSNGATTNPLQLLCFGNYTVSVTDANGCTNSGSATVAQLDSFPAINVLPQTDTIYKGQSVNLTSGANANVSYNWQPGTFLNNNTISNPVSTPNQDIQYVLTVTDAFGCTASDTANIFVLDYLCKEPEIYIPNAFSPNGDGMNEVLYVYGGQIKELLLRIYDRWGEKVFETTKPGTGWDGTYKGKNVMPGVFVYYLEAVCYDNERFFKKGNITVIR
jgi:gliding motility-associated-like protein